MKEKFNNSTTQRPEGERTIDAALVTIDINSFIGLIKKEKVWEESDRNAITVFKTNGMRIVLIALRKGAEMIKHKVDGLISLQVLEGKIAFKTDEQTVELNKGQMLALHEGVSHDVLAKEETIFLLTLTTTLETK
jgi:quercetin dioxygenase-like cupin family protein